MPHVCDVACDESGSEGENLTGGNTDVFAHASVALSPESASECVQEIRRRIGSPAQEYKANHLLREKHRAVLEWLLAPWGPIHGKAHVHLVDKAFYAVGSVIELLGERRSGMAVTLYREGPRAFGDEHWRAFLEAANDLMRVKNRRGLGDPVEEFFHLVDVLRPAGTQGGVRDIVELIRQGRPRADVFRAGLLHHRVPVLDPLIPAIVRTVTHWIGAGTPVSIVHDRQPTLTDERIAALEDMFSPHLLRLRLVESRLDARVQIADFLAGVARKIAEDELNNRGDAVLTALLRPYVDTSSIWADTRSWSLLGPPGSQPESAVARPGDIRWPHAI